MAKRPYWQKCALGPALRAAIGEQLPPNVRVLRGNPDLDRDRADFIAAGKKLCVEKCGGCPLTEAP